MNIVYATDDNYVRPLGVSMVSLFENNKDTKEIIVYIIENNVKEESKIKLYEIAQKYKRSIKFIDFKKICSDLHINVKFPLVAYGRLFLYKLEEVDKILYLDSDTIVNSSIEELYETNIDEYEVAGVQDNAAYYLLKKIGMAKKDRYINSGVLLINLKKWRENDIGNRFLKFIKKNNGKVNHHDQGVINGVCKNSTLILNPKYNMMPEMISMTVKQSNILYNVHNYYTQDEINEAVKSPVIIHYIEKFYSRPWKIDCTHPMKDRFFYYLDKTTFSKSLDERGLNKKIQFRKKIYDKYPFIIYVIFEKILNIRRIFL